MHLLKKTILLLIKGYQLFISPLSVPSCKFYPSCSTYAVDAINEYGAIKGVYYAFIRFIKCGPFHKGGYDPVENLHKKCSSRRHFNFIKLSRDARTKMYACVFTVFTKSKSYSAITIFKANLVKLNKILKINR